jgi:PAS fold.
VAPDVGRGFLEALINLFWAKYADLHGAIGRQDLATIAKLDAELDPLLEAIFSTQARDQASVLIQFRFALKLLKEEADDRGCVRRNVHLMQMLVERYLAGETADEAQASDAEGSEIANIEDATVDGFLDDAVLNRLSQRVMVVTPGYRILYTNDTNASRFAISREQLIGKHVAELVGLHCFRNEFKSAVDRCLEGKSLPLTYAVDLGGEIVVMRCRMSPFALSPSKPACALVVMEEEADRRRRPAA